MNLIGVEATSLVDKCLLCRMYSIIIATIHTHTQSAPEFKKGSARIIFQPSWSKSSLHTSWLLQADAEHALSKGLGVSWQALQKHLQTTIIEDVSQKALGVQISLIKMGKAIVGEVRGGWLSREGGGE